MPYEQSVLTCYTMHVLALPLVPEHQLDDSPIEARHTCIVSMPWS
jgi:hypothetical protein